MQSIVISAMVIALIAAYPGYRLLHQAYFTSERWWKFVTLAFCFIMPIAMATGLFYIPFIVNEGKQLTFSAMFTDFIIYAICPAGAIAILGYAADFIADGYRPRRLVIAGAACFAIAMLPTMFYFYSDDVMQRRGIVLTEDDASPSASGNQDDSGGRNLSTSDPSDVGRQDEKQQAEGQPAEGRSLEGRSLEGQESSNSNGDAGVTPESSVDRQNDG